MDSKKELNVLHSVGLATVILPYYSRYRKWGGLMKLLCKDTSNLWSKYFEVFRILSKMTSWPTDVIMISRIVRQVKLDKILTFNAKSTLKIDCKSSNDYQFIKSAAALQFPNFETLQIWSIESIDEISDTDWLSEFPSMKHKDMNTNLLSNDIYGFLSYSIPMELSNIFIHSSLMYEVPKAFSISLCQALSCVTNVIYLTRLRFKSNFIKFVKFLKPSLFYRKHIQESL